MPTLVAQPQLVGSQDALTIVNESLRHTQIPSATGSREYVLYGPNNMGLGRLKSCRTSSCWDDHHILKVFLYLNEGVNIVPLGAKVVGIQGIGIKDPEGARFEHTGGRTYVMVFNNLPKEVGLIIQLSD